MTVAVALKLRVPTARAVARVALVKEFMVERERWKYDALPNIDAKTIPRTEQAAKTAS
jgi:hypothetical protein